MKKVEGGERPQKPDIAQSLSQTCFDNLWFLIEQCWLHSLEERLSIDLVSTRLDQMLPTAPSSKPDIDGFRVAYEKQQESLPLAETIGESSSILN